jgi:hypothetical protein
MTSAVTVTLVSGTTYQIGNLSGLTGADGAYVLTVNAGGIQDGSGNGGSGSGSVSWVMDATAPTVTINQAAGQADPASGSPINFTVFFSEAITGFSSSDVVLGGTASGALSAVVTGSGTTYNVAVSGMTGAGTVTASVVAGAASDTTGNSSLASTSSDNSVDYQVASLVPILVTGSDAGTVQPVKVYDAATGVERLSFLAYGPSFAGGVRVATGDVNGDGVLDIITGAGAGGSPHVKVFDGNTGTQLAGSIGSFLAYNRNFAGGVFVASADVDRDGFSDVITGPGSGGGPHVRVYSGRDGKEIAGFFAFGGSFRGGVQVATADVNGDGGVDIVAAPGAGGGPHIRVFDAQSGVALPGTIGSFFAYDAGFTGGVYVAAGDLNGDGHADVITAPASQGGPHVRGFSGADGRELVSLFAYAPAFLAGVRVASVDVDGDGRADIVTAPGAGGGPHVRVFHGTTGSEIAGLFAYGLDMTRGVFVAGRAAPQVLSVAPDSLQLPVSTNASPDSAPLVGSSVDPSRANVGSPQSHVGFEASLDSATTPLQLSSRKLKSLDEPWLAGGQSTAHDDLVRALTGPRLLTLDQALEAVDRVFGKLA